MACAVALWAFVGVLFCRAQSIEYLPGVDWPEPPVVTPGSQNSQPPSDAVVLFDGTDLSAWNNGDRWQVVDGIAIVGKDLITTKQSFGDCQLHIEWSAPAQPQSESQQRGNSGVFFGAYEIQILDSYQSQTYFDGQAGAIYKQTPPMVNAMRPPGEWNVYDLLWTAPRFCDDGSLRSPAYLTSLHNGVLILNHFQLLGDTAWHRPPQYEKHPAKLPISLQDHGYPVRFRNIWVREWKPIVGKQAHPPRYFDHETGETKNVEASCIDVN